MGRCFVWGVGRRDSARRIILGISMGGNRGSGSVGCVGRWGWGDGGVGSVSWGCVAGAIRSDYTYLSCCFRFLLMLAITIL